MTSSNEEEDLFSDQYIPLRKRKYNSINEIANDASNPENQMERWQKHTRKDTNPGPESLVKEHIRKHLTKVYHAKVIRTNSGSIVDREGNTIYLGETGQSDLHVLLPLEIDGFIFGIMAAVEVKARGKKPSAKRLADIKAIKDIRIKNQATYLQYIRRRGGIGIFADCTEDVDIAILEKTIEIQSNFTRREELK